MCKVLAVLAHPFSRSCANKTRHLILQTDRIPYLTNNANYFQHDTKILKKQIPVFISTERTTTTATKHVYGE